MAERNGWWIVAWAVQAVLMFVFLIWLEVNVQAMSKLNGVDRPIMWGRAALVAMAFSAVVTAALGVWRWWGERGSEHGGDEA